MAMTKHFVEVVIKDLKWQPYIKRHWMDFGSRRGGVIITFKGHEQHEYQCSQRVANEILKLAK
jgi:hypothetical protein